MKTIVEFGNKEFLVSWRLDFNNDEIIVIYSIKDKDDLELYDQVSQHKHLYDDYIRLVRDVEEVEKLYA